MHATEQWRSRIHSIVEGHQRTVTALGVSVIVALICVGVQQAFLQGDASLSAVNIARRLGSRLQHRGLPSGTLEELTTTVQRRQQLLRAHVVAHFPGADGLSKSIEFNVSQAPDWIIPSYSGGKLHFALDEGRIRQVLKEQVAVGLKEPEDAVISAVQETDDVRRVTGSGVAKVGDIFSVESSLEAILTAVDRLETDVTIPIEQRPGQIVNATGTGLGSLTLLATGRSNFRGSTWSRIQNVRKALSEHVNNVLVAPGERFSFNATLGGPVTTSRGWYMAKVIVNGVDLVEAPGGGICQASTTTFRAFLNAGFVPEERRAHSLYVSYYEQYGVGIDATVFPGSQDLTFRNDTGNYLLIQAYTDGNDAFVNIYGTPDGRKVVLEGPYFASTAPADFHVNGRNLYSNEIAWTQRVTYPDGRMNAYAVLSQYRWLPKNLAQKYAPMHASAEL